MCGDRQKHDQPWAGLMGSAGGVRSPGCVAASKLCLGLSRCEGETKSRCAIRMPGNCDRKPPVHNMNCGPAADRLIRLPGKKGCNMHAPETVRRFIELRAQGW